MLLLSMGVSQTKLGGFGAFRALMNSASVEEDVVRKFAHLEGVFRSLKVIKAK